MRNRLMSVRLQRGLRSQQRRFPLGVLRDFAPESCSAEMTTNNTYRFGDLTFRFMYLAEGKQTARQRSRRCFAYSLNPTRDCPDRGTILRRSTFAAREIDRFEPLQIARFNFITCHGFPALNASRFFISLGVDPFSPPVLNECDAYAVTQAAIWRVFENVDPELININQFILCDSLNTPHEKNPKLSQALHVLYKRAVQENGGILPERAEMPVIPRLPVISGRVKDRVLRIISFGRPKRRRIAGDRLLIGPFAVSGAHNSFTPIGVCLQRRASGMRLVNDNNEPIVRVIPGQRFYISMRRKTARRNTVIVAKQSRIFGMFPYVTVGLSGAGTAILSGSVGVVDIRHSSSVAKRVVALRRRIII